MILDYYTYYGIIKKPSGMGIFRNKGKTISDIRSRLPDTVRRELLFHSNIRDSNCIDVDIHKTEVVVYLDKIMDVKNYVYGKGHNIEISEEERSKYAYYYIDVRSVEWDKHIKYEITRPTCDNEICPYGATIISPIQINGETISRIKFGRIHGPWLLEVKFIISDQLGSLFKDYGISGLSYERCELTNNKNDIYYMATVTKSVIQHAIVVYLHNFCERHSIIIQGDRCDIKIFRKDVSECIIKLLSVHF